MKSFVAVAAAILSLVAANPVAAALAVGDNAPNFSIRGTQGGAITTIDLAELLKKGPVVLYFIPSSFNSPSAAESREFADNIDAFRAAGASVVGMSRDTADGVESLGRFSIEECAGKFPMAAANGAIVNGFNVDDGAQFNTRTTYVIAPSGKIAFVHDDDEHHRHVSSALAFVQGMKK